MKRAGLFHPRVFDDKTWADGYFKRNRWNITRVGKDFASMLVKNGFTEGRILDVGCGFAAVPIEIARMIPGVQITGIDLGMPLLDIGRNLIEEAGLTEQITLMKGDALAMDFEDNAFDLVINTFLVHIVEEPVRLLNEMERITAPGGKIMIRDLRRGFLAHFIHKFKTGFTQEEASEVFDRSGIRKGTFSNGPFWWDYMAGL